MNTSLQSAPRPTPAARFESFIEPLEARIAPAVFIVTNLLDESDGGTPANPLGADLKLSLREALALADVNPATKDAIIFKLPAPAPALHGVNTIKLLNSAELHSLGNVAIIGPGAGKLIIDGDGKSRVFHFGDNASTHDNPVSISGLSIVHGNTTGNGGGIYSTESLALKNVVISGNTADQTAGVHVQGYPAAGTHATISNCVISGNTGGTVGGVHLYFLKSFAISNTVVTGNTGNGHGGGIYAVINNMGTVGTITGCQISNNTAGNGGGLKVSDVSPAPNSKITISATKITGNVSTNTGVGRYGGGGLYAYNGNIVVTGCTISNNTAV